MRPDLVDLNLFLAVVEAGSITHGASNVGLSLPAASERLRNMELASKVKLLERGRRGIQLTPAGEALAHHARLIHRQMAQMRGELGEHARDMRGTVRLATNTAALTEFLPERLAPWMAAHPRTDIELKERQSVEVAKAVSAGLVEIGVLSDQADTSGLQLRPFAIDRLVVVVPRGHALSARRSISFEEILDQRFIGLAGGALQDHINAQAARVGVKLKVRVQMRTFEGICHLAAAGIGFGVLPETAAHRCRGTANIACVRLSNGWARRRLSVCVRSEKELPRPARELYQHLGSGVGQRQ